MRQKSENPEIRDLTTHDSGAVTLHETIETNKPVQITEPNNGAHPGRFDAREERFLPKTNNGSSSSES